MPCVPNLTEGLRCKNANPKTPLVPQSMSGIRIYHQNERKMTMKAKGSGRATKIVVDIFMTLFLVLSFIRWDGGSGFVFHAIVGTACAIFFTIHIFIHRKWL